MQRKDSSQIQRSQVLEKLINARGGRVPLPEILACAAQYNSRIFDLRKLGFRIVNERERVNGQIHTWFRLISGPNTPDDQKLQRQNRKPGACGMEKLFRKHFFQLNRETGHIFYER